MKKKVNNKKWIYLTLGIIIIIGFLLRIYKLSYQSIWIDEAFSIYNSQQSLINVISLKDPTPPLYLGLLHFWIRLFGTSEFYVRMLSVIFGTASVFVIYLLGEKIINEKVGIISSLMLAINPLHIYFSQEARVYSLLLFLSLLSMYFYIEYLNSNSIKGNTHFSKGIIFGYVLSTVLFLYSHFYALLIVLVQNSYLLIVNKFKFSKIKNWILIQTIIFVFYIPWILQMIHIIQTKTYLWITKPQILELIYMIYNFFSGSVFSYYGLALTIICLSLIIKYKWKNEKNSLFLMWIIVPVLIPLIFSFLFKPIFTPKYVYFVSLPIYIIIAQTIFLFKKRNTVVIVSIIMLLSLATLFIQQNTITKDSWKNVAEHIKENYKENDKIVIMNAYEVMPFSYYFNKECFIDKDIYTCSYYKGIYAIDTLKQIQEITDKNVWLIVSREAYNEEAKKVVDYFKENYKMTESNEYRLYYSSVSLNNQYFEKYNLEFNRIRVFYFEKY